LTKGYFPNIENKTEDMGKFLKQEKNSVNIITKDLIKSYYIVISRIGLSSYK